MGSSGLSVDNDVETEEVLSTDPKESRLAYHHCSCVTQHERFQAFAH